MKLALVDTLNLSFTNLEDKISDCGSDKQMSRARAIRVSRFVRDLSNIIHHPFGHAAGRVAIHNAQTTFPRHLRPVIQIIRSRAAGGLHPGLIQGLPRCYCVCCEHCRSTSLSETRRISFLSSHPPPYFLERPPTLTRTHYTHARTHARTCSPDPSPRTKSIAECLCSPRTSRPQLHVLGPHAQPK